MWAGSFHINTALSLYHNFFSIHLFDSNRTSIHQGTEVHDGWWLLEIRNWASALAEEGRELAEIMVMLFIIIIIIIIIITHIYIAHKMKCIS